MEKPKKRIGRPPRTDEPVRITARLPAEVRKMLKVIAEEEQVPEGDVIAFLVLGRYLATMMPRDARRKKSPQHQRWIAMHTRLMGGR